MRTSHMRSNGERAKKLPFTYMRPMASWRSNAARITDPKRPFRFTPLLNFRDFLRGMAVDVAYTRYPVGEAVGILRIKVHFLFHILKLNTLYTWQKNTTNFHKFASTLVNTNLYTNLLKSLEYWKHLCLKNLILAADFFCASVDSSHYFLLL